MMQQLIAPDLTTVGNVGWCLAFVEDAYNATIYTLATADMAWNATQFPHKGEQPPSDVSVPVWFTYKENGFEYGHVAINVPGRGVLSSPPKVDGQIWFKSIEECRQRMGCQAYIGWSEDIAYKQVVKGEDMGQIEELQQQVKDQQDQINTMRPALVNANLRVTGLETELEAERKGYEAQIADLKATHADAGGEFEPYTGVPLFIKKVNGE